MTRRFALFVATALVLAACNDDGRAAVNSDASMSVPPSTPESVVSPTTDEIASPPAASPGCSAAPLTPGDDRITLDAAGLSGAAERHVPTQHDGTTPLPLMVDLHGWSEPANVQVLFSGLSATADEHGFVVITPEIDRPVHMWNTAAGSADIAWIAALIDDTEAALCIDTNRVYATGMSNGAMMTSRLGCELSDRIAAIAPVAGVRHPTDCSPTRPVPLITFHGTADDYLAYTGGYGPKVALLPRPDGSGPIGTGVLATGDEATSVPDMVAAWAAANGCGVTPTDTRVADDVVRRTWDCPAGDDTTLYTVEGGGHTWPGSPFGSSVEDRIGHTTMSISANELMWAFFAAHPLPA